MSPRRWTSPVESSMSAKRSVTTPLGNDRPVNPPTSLCGVRERVVERVERAVARDAHLERGVGRRVVDRERDAVVLAAPEQADLETVVLPICEFLCHVARLAGEGRRGHGASSCLGGG